MPDNVLFADGDGEKIRRDLLDKCNLHTILRLPMSIEEADKKATMFYSIMFFYYSLYDGAKDKRRIKEKFEKTISSII